jgi:GMP reductase
MKCSIDFDKAVWMSENDYFYVLHRFYDYNYIFEWVANHQHLRTVSISLGVQDVDMRFMGDLYDSGLYVDFITIDVAHAHSVTVKDFLLRLRTLLANKSDVLNKDASLPKIVVGNVTTPEAVRDLVSAGADAIKVGIGQGHVCTTRLQTGFGVPMFQCIQECVQWRDIYQDEIPDTVPIIADGGVSHYGDVAKALVAGADMVMVGSMFARCIDSPADTIGDPWKEAMKKRWYGSASEFCKGERKHVEGIERVERTNGLTYEQMLSEWEEALQSAISYAGGTSLESFKQVQHIVV